MPFNQSAKLFELLSDRADAEGAVAAARGRLTQIEKSIAEFVKPQLDAAFAREGQAAGTVKFALDNHIYKAVIDKRVDWDSEALRELAREMPLEDAEALFKVKYTVAETVFKAIIEPALKAKLTVARVVKYSEPKISLAD